ncbi:microsomal triglyceride transfer protein large subunit [Holotrichia oblita]|uniref:Microsomal triglyceride transfer protein large subunit n=1 Tax=Holotrichia oblita TaxID=644536 RepID=A0ACB9SM46_HOLOL|nr:microsomal triglyceride transfer protein large subunit [Holotrichia oblita]
MLHLTQNFAAIFLALYCGFCYGFVLISSASAGAGGLSEKHFFEVGSGWNYKYVTRILLSEKGDNVKDIGFLIDTDVLVESVWASGYTRLLKFTLKSPKLSIKSSKSHESNGFASHSSKLDPIKSTSFYGMWNMGKIEKLLLPKDDTPSLSNLERGIVSLFQFQLLDQDINEKDSSGECEVSYISLAPNKFTKIKKLCHNTDLPYIVTPDFILSTITESKREASYELDSEIKYLLRVESKEEHTIFLAAKEEVGNKVQVLQTLDFIESKRCTIIDAENFDDVFYKIVNKEGLFTEESLISEKEPIKTEEPRFSNLINDYRDSLKSKSLGSLASAKSIIPLIKAARKSSKNDIDKVFQSKKNQKILHQLLDILGFAQTMDSYTVVMNKIHFDDRKHEDLSERYLWSLSLASHPNPDIILALLDKYKKVINMPEKVKETLLLSLGSMANRLSKLPKKPGNVKVINSVRETITNELDAAKTDNEKYILLRALRNLKVVDILPTLFQVIKTGTQKEGILAWKTIRAMDPSDWNEDVLNIAKKTFLQLDKQHDSSSRTLAVDIILAKNPSDEDLKYLIYYLISNDKAFEVKQYVLQLITMLTEDNPGFRDRVINIIKADPVLNNYHILGQKGFSLALKRKFLDNGSSNGTLLTIQEMSSGIVKRGVVNVMMDRNDVTQEIFSLGVFSNGLGSFLGSDSDSTSNDPATAGMELAVLGTQIRPFKFFEGQGELMGHVWSGTASDRTTAYQALVLLQDHVEHLRIGSGFIAEIDFKGATSFDLSGKIEFSLWNRNAVSLVEKSAGFVFTGTMKVENSFVSSQVEFMSSIEPKLSLQTDIDFYSNVNLCMRLSQPDSLFRHNIYKIERIPGSKHRLRKVLYRKHTVPGKTYALNKKNSDMCNQIFK